MVNGYVILNRRDGHILFGRRGRSHTLRQFWESAKDTTQYDGADAAEREHALETATERHFSQNDYG